MTSRENLVLKKMRELLAARRAPTIGLLLRIFASPEGEVATKRRISMEILGSHSSMFFGDLAKAASDLFTGSNDDRDQKKKLIEALAAARTTAASLTDDIMIQMIDKVDVDILCPPTASLNLELRRCAEEAVDA